MTTPINNGINTSISKITNHHCLSSSSGEIAGELVGETDGETWENSIGIRNIIL